MTWADSGHATRQIAYTLDVSRKGARLAGITGLADPGQLIAVRRKTNEARFRVGWIGKPHTPQEGQIGVECVDPDKMIWDVDFANVHEDFEVMGTAKSASAWISQPFSAMGEKFAAYPCRGTAKVWTEGLEFQSSDARLTSIGLSGCRLDGEHLPFDTPLLLQLFIGEAQLTVKGRCQNDPASAARIEFTHIRRGDRPVLEALVSRLSKRK